MGYGQQVKHGVGGAAHRYVECHCVEHCLAGGYVAGKHALVIVVVVGEGVLYDLAGRLAEQLFALTVGGHYGAVAGQCKAYGLVERVHRVGGEHSRAGAAGGTAFLFEQGDGVVAHRVVGCIDHYVDEVERTVAETPCLHGASRHEYRRDVESHGCHEHSGGHFVAVGYAHHRVGLVGVDHIFHRVGDEVARRE